MERLLEWREEAKERIEISGARIREIPEEQELSKEVSAYFSKEAEELIKRLDLLELIISKDFDGLSLEARQTWYENLYELEEVRAYHTAYSNPSYAVSRLGEEVGRELSHLAYLIGRSQNYLFKGNLLGFARLLEFFLELYSVFRGEEGKEAVQSALYYFKRDNLLDVLREEIKENFTSDLSNTKKIILEADLTKPDYLYDFGNYVNEEDKKVSIFFASLPEEKIRTMARTHVDGFIEGFETMGISLEGKKTVRIYSHLGFERLIREELNQLEEKGLLASVIHTNEGRNRQVDFDHKSDYGLYFDDAYVSHYLEAYEKALSENEEELKAFAGPVIIETFGEEDFEPETKVETVFLDEKKRELFTEFTGKKYQILNTYSPADKRSFSIIAYPLPSISKDKYEEIFEDIIRINNMENKTYKRIQQVLIDTLDKGDYVHVLGRGENETNIKVKLQKLQNPDKETNFENCGADVNIPVGEVFTSPQLMGTDGILHVSQVYLKGLLYKDLRLEFKDGKVVDYSLKNFDKEEDNRKYIEENLLYHHKTLPLGEFAIGTNTLAYMVGIKYDISGKLPILIAEKTGPHFAVGDTCYPMQEDHAVFNPDGKEIVARENECSALRKTDISKAYFNCHTDITLPYSELGSLCVYTKKGERIDILRDGFFVLAGTEELNQYFKAD